MYDTVVIDGDVNLIIPETADCDLVITQDGEVGEFTVVHNDNYYMGETDVTPSSETQILETASLVMGSNITINPIPSNYGLITWNGSTLLVS